MIYAEKAIGCSSIHIRSPVGVLNNFIDTTDTNAVCHLNFDEAAIAPPGAPRILDDPVRDASVLEASRCGFVAAVPPFVDFACWSRAWLDVTVIVILFIVIIIVISFFFSIT